MPVRYAKTLGTVFITQVKLFWCSILAFGRKNNYLSRLDDVRHEAFRWSSLFDPDRAVGIPVPFVANCVFGVPIPL